MTSTLSLQSRCCICGVIARERCAPCGAAGVEIRFCSREHQKLIWSADKHICGPNHQSPFRFPSPSQDEVDSMKAKLGDKLSSRKKDETRTYADEIAQNLECSLEEVSTTLDYLTTSESATLPAAGTAAVICTIRNYYTANSRFDLPDDGIRPPLSYHPNTLLSLLAAIFADETGSPGDAAGYPVSEAWYGKLLTHADAALALLDLERQYDKRRSRARSEEMLRLYLDRLEDVRKLADELMDEKKAQGFRRALAIATGEEGEDENIFL